MWEPFSGDRRPRSPFLATVQFALALCAATAIPCALPGGPAEVLADEFGAAEKGRAGVPRLADGMDERIRRLRVEARYAEAAGAALQALRLRESDPGGRPCEIESARWELALLERLAALPVHQQLEYARADSLEQSMPRWSQSGWKVKSTDSAARWVAIVEKLLGESVPETARVLASAGVQHYGAGDFATAEEHCRRALAIYRRLGVTEHPRVAYAMSGLGASRMHLGDLAGAEPYLRGSLEIYLRTLGPGSGNLSGIYHLLGSLLENQGNYAEAETFERRAVELVGLPPNLGMWNRLASILLKLGRSAEAESQLREAVRYIKSEPTYSDPSIDNAETRRFLADALEARGEPAAAVAMRREGLEVVRAAKGEDHPSVACFEIDLAGTLCARGEFIEAELLARSAAARALRTGGERHPLHARALLLLGRVLARQGEWSASEEALLRAAEVFDAARTRAGEGFVRAMCELESPYGDLACVHLERGAGGAAWSATEHALARTLADLLVASERRGLSSGEEARERKLGSALGELERRLARDRERAYRSGDPRDARTAEETAEWLTEAQSDWADFRGDLALRHPLAEGEPYSLERVQRSLPPDAAIVGWVDPSAKIPNARSWGYVIRRRGPVRWVPLPSAGTRETPDPLDSLRRGLLTAAEWPVRVPPDRGLARAAEALCASRVAPLLAHADGAARLIVIPSGPMIGLPLESLRDERGRWLDDRFAISYTPSATVFGWLAERGRRRAGERAHRAGGADHALVVADPSLHSAPQLLFSRREADGIAARLPGSTMLLGSDASEARLTRLAAADSLRQYRLLHIATHALVDNRMPGRSALLLADGDDPAHDGRLTTHEIMRDWQLDADLVTLSGCRTALGPQAPGEGYLGFAQALFQAGAHNLLVSLWRVEDRATAMLMERFYRNLLGPGDEAGFSTMEKTQALREARQWLREWRDGSGERPYEHPVYWSGFVLLGS